MSEVMCDMRSKIKIVIKSSEEKHFMFSVNGIMQIVLNYLQYEQAIRIWKKYPIWKCIEPVRPVLWNLEELKENPTVDYWYIIQYTPIVKEIKIGTAVRKLLSENKDIFVQCGGCSEWYLMERHVDFDTPRYIEIKCYLFCNPGNMNRHYTLCPEMKCAARHFVNGSTIKRYETDDDCMHSIIKGTVSAKEIKLP